MIAELDLRAFVRDIPDFPKPGIVFKDITPLLLNAGALDAAVSALAELVLREGFAKAQFSLPVFAAPPPPSEAWAQ